MDVRLAILFTLAFFSAASAPAATIVLAADRDTSIFANSVNNSLGGGPGFFSGTNANASPRRALLSFDLSSLPANAVITDVRLILTLALVSGGSPGSATIGLYDLSRNWGEGTVGSTATGVGSTGNGFTADPGDATWNAAATPGTTWTTPGGDHAATASGSLLLNGTTVGTAYTWLSTPQMVADAQSWYNSPGTNHGWELINANETTANSVYAFYSSEWHSFAGGNAAQEPALEVTYTVPEPCAGLWLAAASALCLGTERRHARIA